MLGYSPYIRYDIVVARGGFVVVDLYFAIEVTKVYTSYKEAKKMLQRIRLGLHVVKGRDEQAEQDEV
jgi:hypothetical protein